MRPRKQPQNTPADAKTVAEAIVAHGCFIAATCRACGAVKRPLVDVEDDDGALCAECIAREKLRL